MMNENDFQEKIGELISQIDELPPDQRHHLTQLAEQTKARHAKLRDTVKGLQENLDYLRLSVKYLVFDLEATRRENTYLRKMLDTNGHDEGDEHPGS